MSGAPFGEEEGMHRIYTGHHSEGTRMVPFGKCLCGAYLHGQEEIDEHRELENSEKKFRSVHD